MLARFDPTPPSRIRDLAKNIVFRQSMEQRCQVLMVRLTLVAMVFQRNELGLLLNLLMYHIMHRREAEVVHCELSTAMSWALTGCAFIYVGRIWSGKGLDTLLSAYRKVRSVHLDVSLLLVGDGPEQRRLQAENGGLSGVVWAGFVQPAHLPGIYSIADVMVFPTLGDANGLVVEEAMAAGLPVISTSAAGDIRARVPEGVAGYVVPPADPDALATRMIELARTPDLRAAMGDAGQQIASGFVPKRMLTTLKDLCTVC